MRRRTFLKWTGLGLITPFLGGTTWFNLYDPDNPYYSGPASNHFNGKIFFNPGGIPPRRLRDLLKWQLLESRTRWPANFPSEFHGTKPDRRINGRDVRVTMVGHATLLIQTAGMNFLTDPVWSRRASPVQFAGPKRANPPGIEFENLPPIDYVLLTHNHYDHLDLNTLDRLVQNHDPQIICPLGNDTIIRGKTKQARFIVGDWHDKVRLSDDVVIHFEPCHHWSARGTKDRRMALWSAFVLETSAGKIYHVGDTGFHEGTNYKALFEKHGEMRLAILPFGAYEPRWFMKGQHQNPDEAVQGHLQCRARTTLGHHWGTFQLTNEGVDEPIKALEKARAKHGVDEKDFVPLKPGQVWQA